MATGRRSEFSGVILAFILSLAVLGVVLARGPAGVSAAPPPDLTNSYKTVSSSNANPGQTITYTIVLSNTGGTSPNAQVTDTIPANLTYILGSASAGATYVTATKAITWTGVVTGASAVSVTFSAAITTPLPNGTAITNSASIYDGSSITSSTPAVTTTISSSPNLSTSSKQVSAAGASPGQTLTYTVVLINTGNMNASARVTDTLPVGVTYASASASNGATYDPASRSIRWSGAVTVGTPVSITYRAVITSPLDNGSLITNSATVNDGNGSVFDTAPVTTTISSSPDLTPSAKTVKRSISSPGGTVSYSIVVSNTGTMNIAARVTDTLPLSLTYVANSLQSTMGTSLYDSGTGSVLWAGPALVNVPVTIGYQAKVPASAASGATIANTASVQAVGSTPRETLPVTVTVASNPSRIGWQNLGLYGARMEDVAIDPTTGIVLLASGGTTGVYRSVDGGNSWLPSTAFGGCLRLLLDESSGTAYVSCRPEPNQSGLWKSTDAGLTWVSVLSKALYPAFSDGEVTAVAMAGTTLYVADWNGGVWASTNAGQTWTRRAVTQSTPVNALAADATAPAVVYATTSSRAFKSTNAGATWAEVTPSGGSVTGLRSIAVNPHNPSAVFIGTGADGGYRLYKSVDSGLNWTTISLLSGSVSWIEFHPSDANTLFTQHMRSTDNGDTWQGFNVGGGGLAIDPTNPNIIYGGSTQGAHKSIDGGATWTEIDTGLEEVAVTGVAQNPRDVNFFLIGSKMGFGRTLDSGANWTWPLDLSTLPQPDMFGNAVAVEPSAAYLSGGDSILGRSTDNGATWSAGNLQQVVQNDLGTSGRPGVGDIGLVPGETGHLFAAVRESPEGNPTPKGAVYESTDRGLTWTSTGLTGVPVNAIGFVPTASGTVIYAGVGDSWGRYAGAGSVYTSTVGSTSVWRQTTMSTTAPVIIKLRVDPTSPLVIYAGGGFVQTGTSAATMKGVLYKTNDGGATWREITPKLPDSGPTEIRAIAIDPGFTSNVFCSQGNVVYQSVDGGATWSTLSESNLGMEGIDALIVPLVAPSPVVTFTATVSGSQAVLNWTNPSDTDLAGVVVKYSTQGFPMLSTEGITLTAKLAGDPGVYTHTNTISGTTYYYSAFTYNQAGRYSLPYQAAANSSAAGLLTSASELSLRSTASLPRRPAAQASNKSLYAAAGGGLFAKEIAGQTSVFLPALTRGFAGAW